jgi:hypothetical protein
MTKPTKPTSYFELSRWHQPDQAPPATEVPAQPATSPWACDPVPPEPPVGVDAGWLPDVTKVKR